MSVQIVCRLTVVLVALFIVPQAVAQSDSPAYCASIINHCHNQNVPSGGLYAGFSGSPAQQRQQWTEFCFAVGMADTCLASMPGECLSHAILNRVHHIGVCTLEYSDFINIDECTDDAFDDSQTTSCVEAAQRFNTACDFLSEVLRCRNESFIRHCGQEWGTYFGSLFTRATAVDRTSELPSNCPLRSTITSDITPVPASVQHCVEEIQDCFEIYTPEFLELATEIPFRRACSNFDRLKSCFSRVIDRDGDCENLVREDVYLYGYVCESGHSVKELNMSNECLIRADIFAGCDFEGSSICLAYENFAKCYERLIRRTCFSRYEDIAIDLAAVYVIPPVMHFLPTDCPLLDRLPSGTTLPTTPWMTAYLTMTLLAYVFAGDRI